MPAKVIIVPSFISGSDTFHLDSAATTNATIVKSGSCLLTGWALTNTNAALRYIAFHDINVPPVAGQRIHSKFGIPPSGAANVPFPGPIRFYNGLCITTVTNAIDNDATAVAIHDLIINLYYTIG